MFFNNYNSNVHPVDFKDMSTSLVTEDLDVEFPFPENYGIYVDLTTVGYTEVYTKDINRSNWRYHFDSILNIMKDGIETERLQKNGKIRVHFPDGYSVSLTIFDYFFNLIMWVLIVNVGDTVNHTHLFFPECITKKEIKKYIDTKFIAPYKYKLNQLPGTNPEQINIMLNNIIDDALYELSNIDNFSFYLANTINLKDTIDLMNKYPEVYDILHADLSGVPLENVNTEAMKLTNRLIEYIKNSDHCLSDSFRAQEGINAKQFREFAVSIGVKPDGQGGIFPYIINKSFINGGVQDTEALTIESHAGRTAQIIAKCNVGTSGHYARILGLNNRDTRLHMQPKFDCHTRNFQKIYMKDEKFLTFFENRYYRLNPNGMEYKLSIDDKHLIGKTLFFRSPMTCASRAKGHGICYKCYGDLAYTNASINIGQLAAELLSSDLTQRLLSAKHLLTALVAALKWNKEFYQLFELECNVIRLADNIDFKGYKLIIDIDAINVESEEDDYEYNEYIDSFKVKLPNGHRITICTEDRDSIYLSAELMAIINKKRNSSDIIELPMETLTDTGLFLIYLSNDELSKTLKLVKDITNKKDIVENNDKDSWLQLFIEAVMDGNLDTIAVHLEVLLANQIRNKENILIMPDWDNLNEEYQLLTLDKALTHNPAIAVSLEYQKLSKALYDPMSFKKRAPSVMDLFFMEKPQLEMVNKNLQIVESTIKSDKDEAMDLVSYIE